MAITSELAFTYAALILHEDGILISAEKINIIMKIDSYWSPLFTKLLEQRIIDLEVAVSLLPLRLSSMATTVKDVAVSVASTLYAKVAGKEEVIHSSDTHDQVEELKEGDGEKKRSYAKKLSSTTMAAKDTVVFASSTVYEKVAGFGSTVMEQPDVGTEQDKVVLMREYLAEKLRPGEVEDEADGLAGLAMWVLRHDGVILVGQESSAEWTQAWSHTVNFSLYREWL